MLGYKTRRIVRKAYTGILKIFSDNNNNTSNFTQKYFTRNNHIACYTSSGFCSLEKKCIRSQAFGKNLKHFPAVCKLLHPSHNPQIRWSSSNHANDLPLLTSIPQEVWPAFFSPFSNLFLTYLVIKPHVDRSFDLREFLVTSKKVVEVISHKLAASEIDDLAEMVTTGVLQELRNNLPHFSVSQRQELAINADDIYFSAPTSVILDNDRERDKKYLHVTTVHHSIKGLKEVRSRVDNFNPFNMQQMNQPPLEQIKLDDDKSHVLNYKFTREYSSDNAGDWLLSGVNHYRSGQALKLPF